jgi:hypothetical protein
MSAESDLGPLHHFGNRNKVHERRADQQINRGVHTCTANDGAGQFDRGSAIGVHFPVAGD